MADRRHRAAAAFIQRGWHVLLVGPTRLPMKSCPQCDDESPEYYPHVGTDDCPHALDTCHGYKSASNDLDHVARMLERNPAANLAIATGASNLVVVDLDLNKKDAPIPEKYQKLEGLEFGGLDMFAYILERYRQPAQPWPDTLTVRTPSGGMHLWWSVEPGTVIKPTVGAFGWLIDVRASGSYVPAPGTRVRDGEYTRTSDTMDATPAPDWLLRHLRLTGHFPQPPKPRRPFRFTPRPDRDRVGQERLGRLADQLSAAPEHSGHDTLVSATYAAAHLVAEGLVDEQDAEGAMYGAGRARGRADSEIRTAWATALTKVGAGRR